MSNRTVAERFWSKVDRAGDCWLWTGCISPRGYGRFGRTGYAHRVAYELSVGPIGPGLEIDHRATCPKHCVNPAHLRPTTHRQNMENRDGAQRNSRSGVRGVSWYVPLGKWRVGVTRLGVKHHGGYYDDLDEAREVARLLRIRLHTHNDQDRSAAS